MKIQKTIRPTLILGTFLVGIMALLVTGPFGSRAQTNDDAANRPSEIDVRGPFGVPKGTQLRAPSGVQSKYIGALQSKIGQPLQVEYNGLTATPRHLFSYGTYLSAPSADAPEAIARNVVQSQRGLPVLVPLSTVGAWVLVPPTFHLSS